jgi:[DsrC]-trisulfide reductase subunit M
MSALLSLVAVVVLGLIAYFGAGKMGLQSLFGVGLPYMALIVFVLGAVYRVVKWARTPVPFRIPTTCGQQKSLSWIKSNNLEAPHSTLGLLGRMALEVLLFRSLFRNTKTEQQDGRLIFGSTKFLWAAGLVFHWTFLVVLVRHMRFFAEPVPKLINMLAELDGFFQIGLPIIYATDALILVALTYLFLRRVFIPQVKYISLAADYFPLLLLLGIVLTGVWMRYFAKVDIVAIKSLAMGLLSLKPQLQAGISPVFYTHLFFVCVLLLYFPFSKLMHFGGVFLSPTRNMLNNNREIRHVNPWNPKVHIHTYEEYEDEFRDKMKLCGLPLDRDPDADAEADTSSASDEKE